MDGEALPLLTETEDETLPPPSEMGGEAQPPAAEVESDTQQPPAEIEGETQPPPLPASVSKVLDDDNLLTEIVVRVGFPTSLVRAAAVCRRWFGLASDPAFLRRFRELHPPRLLGFYLSRMAYPDAAARFLPTLPQPPPPELDAVVRRASFKLDFYETERFIMVGCWNGRVVTSLHRCTVYKNNEVRSDMICTCRCDLIEGYVRPPSITPPFLGAKIQQLQQLQPALLQRRRRCCVLLLCEDGESTTEAKSVVQVFMLRNGDDAWRTHLNLHVDYRIDAPQFQLSSVLVNNKIYMPSTQPQLVVLDLTASSFSTIQLPPGVDFRTKGSTMLSRADDASAVYLIHAKELQLHIWLHKGGNWLLVDNICLREMCARFLEDGPTASLRINHAGGYTGEFLFLEMGQFALYLDVKSRTLHKVYEMTREDRSFGLIYPFMMIWPPILPALKDAPASNAT